MTTTSMPDLQLFLDTFNYKLEPNFLGLKI